MPAARQVSNREVRLVQVAYPQIYFIWTLVAVVALVGAVAVIGYFLPVGHVASRSAELNAPPEAVYALVSDVKNYPSWWPENETTVAVVEAVPPSRFVSRSLAAATRRLER